VQIFFAPANRRGSRGRQFGDTSVQARQDLVVHLRYGLERPVAVPDDVLMSKVKIGGEPHVGHLLLGRYYMFFMMGWREARNVC
jgi:hypothetical protein